LKLEPKPSQPEAAPSILTDYTKPKIIPYKKAKAHKTVIGPKLKPRNFEK